MQALAPKAWKAFLAAVELHFEQGLDIQKLGSQPDLELLFRKVLPDAKDHFWRGRIVIGHELRIQLAVQGEREPEDILPSSKMSDLLPANRLKTSWKALQQDQDWQLPRLGLPIALQYVWGAALLATIVGSFFWPLWCILGFWLLILLIYPAERWFSALAYPDFDQLLAATVKLNWPVLEMGASGEENLRLVFAELVQRYLGIAADLQHEFPQVLIDQPWHRALPQLHLLNGDSLRMQLEESDMDDLLVVMRECLVVGPVEAGPQFWEKRKAFIHTAYDAPPAQYAHWLEAELQKLSLIPEEGEINLWFEDDLFCQVNFWFAVHYIRSLGLKNRLYRIFPQANEGAKHWLGFGNMNAQSLLGAFQQRVAMSEADEALAIALWAAFQKGDNAALAALGGSGGPAFRKLPEVLQAQLERPDRPLALMRQLREEGISEFQEAFPRFNAQMGIYGFGDLQARQFWDETAEMP